MTDRIDPGQGWRMLDRGEIRRPSDESMVSMDCLGQKTWMNCKWSAEQTVGREFVRRRITSRTTKAIATRATVRAAFRDGRIVTRMERNDSGLGEKEMRATIETWNLAPLIGAKYIMLEIQREGEP